MARRLAQVTGASIIPPAPTGERFGTKRRRFGTIKTFPRSYSDSSPNGGKYDENRIRLAAILMAVISTSAAAAPFRVTSSDMREGESLAVSQQFNGFGCSGGMSRRSWPGNMRRRAPAVLR
jgi:hypothetical protein